MRALLHRFRTESGSSAGLTIAAVAVFAIFSLVAMTVIQTGIRQNETVAINTQLTKAAQKHAHEVAGVGYSQELLDLDGTTATLEVGKATVTARLVVTDTNTDQAQVSVVAAKWKPGGFGSTSSCGTDLNEPSSSCVYASETATLPITERLPLTENVDTVAAGSNIAQESRIKFNTVSAGNSNFFAIDVFGQLWAWGANESGQLGDGSTVAKYVPAKIAPAVAFTQVAGNATQATYGLDDTGQLWAWGKKLAPNLMTESTVPVKQFTGKTFTSIALGNDHALAIDTNGKLWAWGLNANGQLGDGTTMARSTPVNINPSVQFMSISAANSTSYAIDTTGQLWAWGRNNYGQLGDGSTTTRTSPVQIKPGAVFTQVSASVRVSSVAAIDTYGRAWAWGRNSSGQLGDGSTTDRNVPSRVATSTKFASISIGTSATAVDRAGNAWSWGTDTIDPANKLPKQVATSKFLMTSSFGGLNAAVDTSHYLWVWGTSPISPGDGTTSSSALSPKRYITDIPKWSSIVQTQSGLTTYGLDLAGQLFSWGSNDYGQLGDGAAPATVPKRLEPKQVKPGTSFTDVKTAPDRQAVFAIDTAGNLFTWGGTNQSGVMGVGTGQQISLNAPMQIKAGTKFANVYPLTGRTYAIDVDGNLWAWGYNTTGYLGDGTKTDRWSPVRIKAGTQFVSVTAEPSSTATYATDIAGKVWAWGSDPAVELANTAGMFSIDSNTGEVILHPAKSGKWQSAISMGKLIGFEEIKRVGGVSNITGTQDMTGDGIRDLLVLDVSGRVWLYPSTSPSSFGTPKQIGSGIWYASHLLAPGDWNGDGFADLMMIDSSASAYLYLCAGTATGIQVSYNTAVCPTIGSGWYYNFKVLTVGDWNSDGKPDLLVRFSDNSLKVYYNQWGAGTGTQIGSGWGGYPLLGLGDFGGDGKQDVLLGSGDTLWAYYGNGTGGWLTGNGVNTGTISGLPGFRPNGTFFSLGMLGNIGTLPIQIFDQSSVVDASQSVNDPQIIPAMGGRNAFIVDGEGKLWSWGLNSKGQIGIGNTIPHYAPVQVKPGTRFTQATWLEAYPYGAAAIDTYGNLWSWGDQAGLGMVGDGSDVPQPNPVQIKPGTTFTSVQKTYGSAYALATDGSLWVWGTSSFGTKTPVQLKPGTRFVSARAYGNTFFAIDDTGKAWALGQNATGQLGLGNNSSGNILKNVLVDAPISNVYTSGTVSFALTLPGDLFAFGANGSGQLGINQISTYQSLPTKVQKTGVANMTAPEGLDVVTPWLIGKVNTADSIVQIVTKTKIPVSSMGLYCQASGQALVAATPKDSAAGWKYANIDLTATPLSSCPTGLYAAVFLEGKPVQESEVSAMVLRTEKVAH